MAQKIQIKRSNTTAVPTTANLSPGELGLTEVGGKSSLFIGNFDGTGVVEIAGDGKMDKVSNPTNGNIVTTDANGQVVDSGVGISGIVGALNYQGLWDATTNTPTLADGTGTKGHYYKVSVAGTTSIDGINEWQVGDWIIFNGTTWDKIDNTETVSSVNGQTGAVVLTKTDIGLDNVDNTSDLNKPISTATQTALDLKLDSSQATTAGVGTSLNGTAVDVVVDNSTVEVNGTNQLQVKDLGITNAKLAGSITDDKLNQITTSNKVAGSSVQITATGGLEDATGLQIKNDTTTGATVAQLSLTTNGAGVEVDNASIVHTSGVLSVNIVDGGTF